MCMCVLARVYACVCTCEHAWVRMCESVCVYVCVYACIFWLFMSVVCTCFKNVSCLDLFEVIACVLLRTCVHTCFHVSVKTHAGVCACLRIGLVSCVFSNIVYKGYMVILYFFIILRVFTVSLPQRSILA